MASSRPALAASPRVLASPCSDLHYAFPARRTIVSSPDVHSLNSRMHAHLTLNPNFQSDICSRTTLSSGSGCSPVAWASPTGELVHPPPSTNVRLSSRASALWCEHTCRRCRGRIKATAEGMVSYHTIARCASHIPLLRSLLLRVTCPLNH